MKFNSFYIYSPCCYFYSSSHCEFVLSCHDGVVFPSLASIVFIVFLCFLVTCECDHSLGFLIELEVIFWAIVLSLYIITVFPWVKWCRFTVTVADCYILKIFCDSSPWISANTLWFRWLHCKFLCWSTKLLLCIMIVFFQINGVDSLLT